MEPKKDKQGHEVEFRDFWDEDADRIYNQYYCPTEEKNVILSEPKTKSKYEDVTSSPDVYNLTPTELDMVTNDGWQNNSQEAFSVLNKVNTDESGNTFVYPSEADTAYLSDLFGYEVAPSSSESGYLDPDSPMWKRSVEHISQQQKDFQANPERGRGFGPQSGMKPGEPTRDEWQVTSYLDQLGVKYVHKQKLGDLDPDTEKPTSEFDIYLPDYIMAIETSPGWHEGGRNAKNFPDVTENDLRKKVFAKEHGIDLVSFDPEEGTETFINEVLVPKLRSVGVDAFEVPMSKKEEGRWDDAEKELDKEYERQHGGKRKPFRIGDAPPEDDKGWEDIPVKVRKEPSHDVNEVEKFGPISIFNASKSKQGEPAFSAICNEDMEQVVYNDYDNVADWVVDHLAAKHPDFKYSPSMTPMVDQQGLYQGYTPEDIKNLREENETKHWLPDYQSTPKALIEEACPVCGSSKTYKDYYGETVCSECNHRMGYGKSEVERDDSQNYPLRPNRGKVNTAIQNVDKGGEEYEATNNLYLEEDLPLENMGFFLDKYNEYMKPEFDTLYLELRRPVMPIKFFNSDTNQWETQNEEGFQSRIEWSSEMAWEEMNAMKAGQEIVDESLKEEGNYPNEGKKGKGYEKGNPFNSAEIYREEGYDWDYPMGGSPAYQEEEEIPFSLKVERQLEKAGYPPSNLETTFGREKALGSEYVMDMWLGGKNYATFHFKDMGSGEVDVEGDVVVGQGYYSVTTKGAIAEQFEDTNSEVDDVHPHLKGDHFHLSSIMTFSQIPSYLDKVAQVANQYPSPYELWMQLESPEDIKAGVIKDFTPIPADEGVIEATVPKEPEPIEWEGNPEPWPDEEVQKVIDSEIPPEEEKGFSLKEEELDNEIKKLEEQIDKLSVSKLNDIGDFYTHKPLNNIDSTTGEESPMQTGYGY